MVSTTEHLHARPSASSDGSQRQQGLEAPRPEAQCGGDVPPASTSPAVAEVTSDGPQPTAPPPAPLPLARVRVGEHGAETARVRADEHGGDLWAHAQHILPDLATHGYILVSGNALKVWVALLVHALAHGSVVAEDDDPPHRPSPRKSAPKPTKPASPRSGKAKVARKTEPTTKTKPKAKVKAPSRPRAAARMVRLEAEWDNGSLSRATNIKNTAIHAAQNELVVLGWMSKQSARNSQGQFGGFRYALQKPPAALPDAAKQRYEKKLNDLFGRAYDLQHLLESAEVEAVGGDCPSHADLFAFASRKLGDGDGRKMVIEAHLRGCAECRKRFKDTLATEQEWGGDR